MVVVVPVELAVVRAAVGGAALLILAKRIHVDLPAKPHELLENSVVVSNARTVERDVAHIRQASVGRELGTNANGSVDETRSLREIIVRDVTLDVVAANRDASRHAIAPAGDCQRIR